MQKDMQALEFREISTSIEGNKYLAEISQNIEGYKQMQVDNKFSAVISATVRPVITYAFTSVFLYILILYIRLCLRDFGMNIETIHLILENDFVQGMHYLFSNIVTFWFGNRLLEKTNNRRF